MEPTSREDLSALMDGELAAEPTRFLLRRLDHDPELAATWSRWHMIRACLAGESTGMSQSGPGADFAARVAAAMQAEAEPPRARQRHWARYVGGGAIAASVAVAALMLNAPNPRVGAPAPLAQTGVAAPSVAAPTTLAQATPIAHADANALTPPWLLARQPTVLAAQPASANVVYGTGLMQPGYLQRVTYSRDAALPYMSSYQAGQPFSIVLLPEAPPPAKAVASRH